MSQLVWLTDLHFDVTSFDTPFTCGEEARDAFPDAVAAVITGDIGTSTSFASYLQSFSEGFGDRPVYFVLGNHDFWDGSYRETHERAAKVSEGQLHWLRLGARELCPGIGIVGHEGWYDGRWGNPEASTVYMNDWRRIEEFRGLPKFAILPEIRKIADRSARQAEELLCQALSKFDTVIFATHFPPFPQATTYQGRVSDEFHLPWYCSKATGDMILRCADTFYDKKIVVLCGHVHDTSDVEIVSNVRVMTGSATYGDPQVTRGLRLPKDLGLEAHSALLRQE
jgi:predicted phosphohydrolase